MKYLSYGRFGWEFGPYRDYLATVEAEIPAALWAFASNEGNYDLTSANSLHDTWLECANVAERPGADKKRGLQIELSLLGQRHDRRIHLHYGNVKTYSLVSAGNTQAAPSQTPHGDLLIHEVVVLKSGLFSHEIVFSKGAIMKIEFSEFDHRIELFKAD